MLLLIDILLLMLRIVPVDIADITANCNSRMTET